MDNQVSSPLSTPNSLLFRIKQNEEDKSNTPRINLQRFGFECSCSEELTPNHGSAKKKKADRSRDESVRQHPSRSSFSLNDSEDELFKKLDQNMDIEVGTSAGGFWNCDQSLVVKEMLMGQVAKNNKEIDEFKRNIQKKLDIQDSHRKSSKQLNKEKEPDERAKKERGKKKEAKESPGKLPDDLDDFNEVYGKDQAKIQSIKFARVKDAYQDTMFKVLQEKGNITKQLQESKNQNKKLQQEIQYLGKKYDMEVKNLKYKLEDEYKTNFQDKESSLKGRFQREVDSLSTQYFELKHLCYQKDRVIYKLCQMIIKQEKDMSNFLLQLKVIHRDEMKAKKEDFGNRTLYNGVQTLNMMTIDRNCTTKNAGETLKRGQQQKENEEEEELPIKQKIVYEERINHLEKQTENLNAMIENWIKELDQTNIQLMESRSYIELMKGQHQQEMEAQRLRQDRIIWRLERELNECKSDLADFQDHMKMELEVKDVIDKRKGEYIEVLQDEMKLAKRILKNPRLTDKTSLLLNFNRQVYYEMEPRKKEDPERHQKSMEDNTRAKSTFFADQSKGTNEASQPITRYFHGRQMSQQCQNRQFIQDVERPVTQKQQYPKKLMLQKVDEYTQASTNFRLGTSHGKKVPATATHSPLNAENWKRQQIKIVRSSKNSPNEGNDESNLREFLNYSNLYRFQKKVK